MIQHPGASSRSTAITFRQFPHRDGALVTDIAGMETPGWSNANRVSEDDEPQVDEKVVDDDSVEDKSVAKKTTTRKSAPKKG